MTSHLSDSREVLRFGFGDTALGILLAAASAQGVAALFLGDDRARLERDLKNAFSGADCVLDSESLADTVAKAQALIAEREARGGGKKKKKTKAAAPKKAPAAKKSSGKAKPKKAKAAPKTEMEEVEN